VTRSFCLRVSAFPFGAGRIAGLSRDSHSILYSIAIHSVEYHHQSGMSTKLLNSFNMRVNIIVTLCTLTNHVLLSQ